MLSNSKKQNIHNDDNFFFTVSLKLIITFQATVWKEFFFPFWVFSVWPCVAKVDLDAHKILKCIIIMG
jgi:hypothetical protein